MAQPDHLDLSRKTEFFDPADDSKRGGGTIEHQDWYLPNPEPSRQQFAAMDYQRDVLQPEDVGLCESVQRGLQSKGYTPGRFVIDPERSELSEHGVRHFQQLYLDALGSNI